MKRENRVITDYIAWLKSIGCRFYAPLKEDLTDLINNVDGVLDGYNRGYDENGLIFRYNVLHWNDFPFLKSITYATPFTFLFDYLKTSQSGHGTLFSSWGQLSTSAGMLVECNNYSPSTLSISFTRSGYTRFSTISYPNSGITNTLFVKCGVIYDGNGKMTRVHNGEITEYVSTTPQEQFPVFGGCVMALGGSITYGGDNWYGTIGNVLMFDKALTQNEINKL